MFHVIVRSLFCIFIFTSLGSEETDLLEGYFLESYCAEDFGIDPFNHELSTADQDNSASHEADINRAIFNNLHADSIKLTAPLYDPGFFSVFNTVLGALDFYEKSSKWSGLAVDFENKGLYYDEKHGPNWWEYYFEPICLGAQDHRDHLLAYDKILFSLSAQFEMSNQRGYELIQRYIHLKLHIQKKLDNFIKKNFKNHLVIGIHYRGTDKSSEAPTVSYETVADCLKIDEMYQRNAKIFVATDEEQFLTFMQETFPGKIISLEAIRSNDKQPIHLSFSENGYQKGEEALLDCLLLSRCNKIYKMASNLSDTSLKFNPNIEIVHLNRSFSQEYSSERYNTVKAINTVLALLDEYENNQIDGFSIEFPFHGEKYPGRAKNWWEHYFVSLSVGEGKTKHLQNFQLTTYGLKNLFNSSRKRAQYLIKKYIEFQPHIQEKVEHFSKNFKEYYVIGVNYVKQSNENLQASLPYEIVFSEVKKQQLDCHSDKPYKIFLVSSDVHFYSEIKAFFPHSIYLYDPNEIESLSFAEREELDLINCILLSKANVVLGTSTEYLKLVGQLNADLLLVEIDTLWLEKK